MSTSTLATPRNPADVAAAATAGVAAAAIAGVTTATTAAAATTPLPRMFIPTIGGRRMKQVARKAEAAERAAGRALKRPRNSVDYAASSTQINWGRYQRVPACTAAGLSMSMPGLVAEW